MNPTLPNFGGDYTYQISDQKLYFFKCQKCNHWSYITYEQESFDRSYASNSNALDVSNIIKNVIHDEHGYVRKVTLGQIRTIGVGQGGMPDNPTFYCVSGVKQSVVFHSIGSQSILSVAKFSIKKKLCDSSCFIEMLNELNLKYSAYFKRISLRVLSKVSRIW